MNTDGLFMAYFRRLSAQIDKMQFPESEWGARCLRDAVRIFAEVGKPVREPLDERLAAYDALLAEVFTGVELDALREAWRPFRDAVSQRPPGIT